MIHANVPKINAWAQSSNRHFRLTLAKQVAGDVGYGVTRQTGKLTKMNNVVVVLRYKTYNDMPYYIFTAYVE